MKDIVEILKDAGYGVVEGEKAVRAKINELYRRDVEKMYNLTEDNSTYTVYSPLEPHTEVLPTSPTSP